MKKTTARHGRRYSTQELRQLMEMWHAEKPVSEIAGALGTTEWAIRKQVTRMRSEGIPLKRRTKGHEAARSNKPWTQEEVEYLFRRRLLGETSEQIASDLNRTVHGVHGMIQKLRAENVPVAMLGQGPKRLWDANALRSATVGRFEADEIAIAEEIN